MLLVCFAALGVVLNAYVPAFIAAVVGAWFLDPFRSLRSALGIALVLAGAALASYGHQHWQAVIAGVLMVFVGYKISEHASSQSDWMEPFDDVISWLRRGSRGFDIDD